MKQVLGPSIILWPLPFYTPEMKGWGFYYPHIPDINQQHVGIMQLDAKLPKKDRLYDLKDQYKTDTNEYGVKADRKYLGFTFQMPEGLNGETGRKIKIEMPE